MVASLYRVGTFTLYSLPAFTGAFGPTPLERGDWALAIKSGGCEPLENVRRQGVEVGAFATPQEFARKLQQRGHQTFILDIGETRDQVVRVRVPDLSADFEFRRAATCR